MGSAIRERGGEELESRRSVLPTGYGRRLGSAIGLGTISILDFLALDDITTAGYTGGNNRLGHRGSFEQNFG